MPKPTAKTTMKVTVPVKADIDTAAWTAYYGTEGTQAIRREVKDHVADIVQTHLRNEGFLAAAEEPEDDEGAATPEK